MAIERVSFPIKNCVFPSFLYVYQRVAEFLPIQVILSLQLESIPMDSMDPWRVFDAADSIHGPMPSYP